MRFEWFCTGALVPVAWPCPRARLSRLEAGPSLGAGRRPVAGRAAGDAVRPRGGSVAAAGRAAVAGQRARRRTRSPARCPGDAALAVRARRSRRCAAAHGPPQFDDGRRRGDARQRDARRPTPLRRGRRVPCAARPLPRRRRAAHGASSGPLRRQVRRRRAAAPPEHRDGCDSASASSRRRTSPRGPSDLSRLRPRARRRASASSARPRPSTPPTPSTRPAASATSSSASSARRGGAGGTATACGRRRSAVPLVTAATPAAPSPRRTRRAVVKRRVRFASLWRDETRSGGPRRHRRRPARLLVAVLAYTFASVLAWTCFGAILGVDGACPPPPPRRATAPRPAARRRP